MKRMNFVIACLRPSQNVKLGIFTGSRAVDGKEMYKKVWCTCKVFAKLLFCLVKLLLICLSRSLRSMAVLSSRVHERRSPPQSPGGFSALARLFYLERPTKTAMLRRLTFSSPPHLYLPIIYDTLWWVKNRIFSGQIELLLLIDTKRFFDSLVVPSFLLRKVENKSFPCSHKLGERTGQVWQDNSRRGRTHENSQEKLFADWAQQYKAFFMSNQEPASAWIFGNKSVRVGVDTYFHPQNWRWQINDSYTK